MVVLNAIKQLLQLNYSFVKDKFKIKFTAERTDSAQILFQNRQVLHGPFKGLKYIGFNTVCSSIYPKLLGSYEKEIQEELVQLIEKQPAIVIDIGCAEGYYAVGLAKQLPGSAIIAADTSAKARNLCQQLARYNQCSNLTVTGTITAQSLLNYNLDNGLIICDCEGYEKQLFNDININHLKKTDLIIETHDFIEPGISTYLEELFGSSHHIKIISSMDDVQKPKYYDYPELRKLSLNERKKVLAEYRPAIMEWLIISPKLNEEQIQ